MTTKLYKEIRVTMDSVEYTSNKDERDRLELITKDFQIPIGGMWEYMFGAVQIFNREGAVVKVYEFCPGYNVTIEEF